MLSNGRLIEFAVFAIIFTSEHVTSQTTAPILDTTNGNVSGIARTYHDETVYQYLRIPFAEPPLGNLRFAKPQSHKPWGGTLDATTLGPSCMQYVFDNDKWLLQNTNISEDCLHLNIYVPRTIDKTTPKSVMIWIHGGGFTGGQGTLFDASYLALHGDVIVVTINYRVGLLGFLSTEDSNSAGNYGLWDQKLAIEWTKANIARFGGDADSLTIFGESAGGYSVGLHTITPLNKGLFKRVISESGVAYSPRALANGARQVAEHLGRLLNCSTGETATLVACLRSKTAIDILEQQNTVKYNTFAVEKMSFINRLGPVIDGEFITDDPVSTLQDTSADGFKFFNSIDIMAGTNSAEGGLMYFNLKSFQKSYNFNISEGIPVRVLCEIVALAVARDYHDNDTKMAERLCAVYTKVGASLSEQGRSTLDVYGDLQFLVPTVRTLLAHSATETQTSRSFQYVFSHQPSFPWIQERPSWLQGANHAGELPFVFGLEAMYPPQHEKPVQEMKLSHQMMTYWSNFAKSGNPNLPRTPDVTWPEFTNDERQFLKLDAPTPKAAVRYHDNRVSFWLTELEKQSTINGGSRTVPFFGCLLIMISACLLI